MYIEIRLLKNNKMLAERDLGIHLFSKNLNPSKKPRGEKAVTKLVHIFELEAPLVSCIHIKATV